MSALERAFDRLLAMGTIRDRAALALADEMADDPTSHELPRMVREFEMWRSETRDAEAAWLLLRNSAA